MVNIQGNICHAVHVYMYMYMYININIYKYIYIYIYLFLGYLFNVEAFVSERSTTRALQQNENDNDQLVSSTTWKPRKSRKSWKSFSKIFKSEFSILAVGQNQKFGKKKTWTNFSEISEISNFSKFSIYHFFTFQRKLSQYSNSQS